MNDIHLDLRHKPMLVEQYILYTYIYMENNDDSIYPSILYTG